MPSPQEQRGQPLHTRYTRGNQILISTFRELLYKLIKFNWNLNMNADVVSIIVLYTFERTHEFVPHVKKNEMTRKLPARSVLGSLTACPPGSVSPIRNHPTPTGIRPRPLSPASLSTLTEEPDGKEDSLLEDPLLQPDHPVTVLEQGVDYKLNFLIGRVLYGFDIHDSPYAAPTDPNPLEILTDSPQGGLFLVPTKMSDWFLNQDGTCIALPVRYRYKHRIVDATVKARETGPYVQITIEPLNMVNRATDQLLKETEEAIARGEIAHPADLVDFESDTSYSEPEFTDAMIDQNLINATAARSRAPDPLMESIHQSYRSSRPSQLVFVGDPSLGNPHSNSPPLEKKDPEDDLVEGLDVVPEAQILTREDPLAQSDPTTSVGLSSQSDHDNKAEQSDQVGALPTRNPKWDSDRKSEPSPYGPPNSPPNLLGPGTVSPTSRTTDTARRWKGRKNPSPTGNTKRLPKFHPTLPTSPGDGNTEVHPTLAEPPSEAPGEDADTECGGTSSDSSLSGPARPAWGGQSGGRKNSPKRKIVRRKLRSKARRSSDEDSDSETPERGLPTLGGSQPLTRPSEPIGARPSIKDHALPRFGGASEDPPAPKLQNSKSPPRRARPSLIATTGSPGQDHSNTSGRSVLEFGPGFLGIDELSLSYLHCRVTPNPHQEHSYQRDTGVGSRGADVAFPT